MNAIWALMQSDNAMQASNADAARDKGAGERERLSLRTALEQQQQQQQAGSGDMSARLRSLQQRLAEQELHLTSAQADSQVSHELS